MSRRPFRFGFVSATARSGEAWAEEARRAEASGYDALLDPDRIAPLLSPVPALAAGAAPRTPQVAPSSWPRAGATPCSWDCESASRSPTSRSVRPSRRPRPSDQRPVRPLTPAVDTRHGTFAKPPGKDTPTTKQKGSLR